MSESKATNEMRETIAMLCRQAGDILRDSFSKEDGEDWKRGVSRFSEVELRLIYLVAAFVEKYFPGDRLFGKDETTDLKGRVWVCDPVDGSYFFTHGIPLYSFSVSLLIDGRPTAAAIYSPTNDRLYYAEEGRGVTLNGKPLTHFSSPSVSGKIVMLSSPTMLDLGGMHNDLREEGCKPIVTYSVVQHAAMVAGGEIAAVVHGGSFLQDFPALKLIVEEAGGIVTDLDGQPLDLSQPNLRGFIAAGPQVHAHILSVASRHLT